MAERFLRKGRKIYLEGSLQTRKWTDQSGQDRYTTEVVVDRFRGELVLLDSNRGGEDVGRGYDAPAPQLPQGGARTAGAAAGGWDAPMDGNNPGDEVPF